MSTFRQKLSTGSSSSSSSGSSSSGSDSESASSHSSTQSDESTHGAENKVTTQNNNHLPSFSDTSDEEEPPKRRKLPDARYPPASTAARATSATSMHSKRNISPAPSLASTSSRRNGYSRAPSTSRPPSVSQPSTSTSIANNNLMSIFNASRASSSLSIKSPELSAGGSSESKSSSSSSENDTTNYAPVFGTVSSTQANFSQINGKQQKATRKSVNKKSNSVLENTAETPATALERMVIDEELLNDIKIEIKSEDEEFEPNKAEIKAVKKPNRKTNKRPATKQKSSSSSSTTSSSSSETESSEAGAAKSSQKRKACKGKNTNESKKNNNNIDALFDELKKTTTASENATTNDTADAAHHKKNNASTKNGKSNGKAQINGTRKRARPPESSEKSEYSTDSDDSDLAPLMTRADAEVATKVFGKRLSTQQSTENGPCLRATRSRRATNKSKLPNGNRASAESGSESTASTHDSSASKSSSATGSASDSGSASVSPTGSESESSSHTSCSSCHTADSSLPEVRKAVRGKRAQNSTSSSIAQNDTPRKLTRSRRRLQQQGDTDSDSDQAINGAERLVNGVAQVNGNTAGIAKRPLGLNGKSRGFLNSLLRESPPICISPPCVQEKMCPIEGCDSKGHLGGTRDRHFLPEACPLYHNMTPEECVQLLIERRKHAENFPLPVKPDADADEQEDSYGAKRVRTTAQKELWDRIHQTWRDFEENPPQPKPQPECEEGNEQREQDLTGMAPEYDLELFRRAQAIAAEAIEDEVADCPVGKGIKYIIMGKYKMKVWYQSPYPDDAARLPKMYICEYCLRYQKSEVAIKRHALKCVWRHPPGDEIYRKGKLQVWQVDGKTQKQYCQHLCLLAKFFLDHKTLYYDVEPFLFYIMTLADIDGCHIVGYFSKEKNSFYNVSCILTLPPYQRKGYGRLLIDFSYLLTRVEGKIGSPEKPLSDLGLISYRSYWKDVLLEYLINRSGNTVSIKDISKEMAIYSYDIVSTLQALGMMKYWKGKHIILKKQDVIDDYLERVSRRGKFPKIDETCLRWSPFVPPDSDNPNL